MVNSSNVLVQTQVPDELRGRVMSIYTLAFFGLMPFGSFIAGRLAEQIGEPATVVAGATVLLITALWIRLRVPEVERGILTASRFWIKIPPAQNALVAQWIRALACGARGRAFEFAPGAPICTIILTKRPHIWRYGVVCFK